ncbi:division/cell wall cluster transcriptional repressor MraZ [Novosphingobium sp.]|uniref:division/cell wall cluster transcriptional repressor MraZ n=1 Tax=Novosphingobium sp. TaxID=1874826 RepID=UPI003B5183C1
MTGGPSKYWGKGFSLRGDKGRFVLPPDFRGTVLAASGNTPILCLDAHASHRCLVGFGLSRADTFEAMVAHEEDMALKRGEPFDSEERLGQISAFAKTKFDESGRFILPDYLGDHARADNGLYFHGGSTHFTIWAPDVLFAMGPGWDGAKANCRSAMAEAASRNVVRGRGK